MPRSRQTLRKSARINDKRKSRARPSSEELTEIQKELRDLSSSPTPKCRRPITRRQNERASADAASQSPPPQRFSSRLHRDLSNAAPPSSVSVKSEVREPSDPMNLTTPITLSPSSTKANLQQTREPRKSNGRNVVLQFRSITGNEQERPTLEIASTNGPLPTETESAVEWDGLREIRSRRGFADNVEYLVRWENYDSDDERSKSWLPRKILREDVPHDVEEFDRSFKHAKRVRRV